MSVIQGNAFSDDDAVDTGDIGHSLRFRRSASANLSRPFSAGDQKTWLWAGFVKPCDFITDHQGLLRFGSSYVGLTNSGGVFRLWLNYQGVWSGHTEGAVRDPTSHMHIVFKHDTTQAVAADRFKVWFNGTLQTFTVDGGSMPAQNADGVWNQSGVHEIGRGSAAYLDGYLSRVCFVGGSAATALTPSDFITFNTEINEWVSKTVAQINTAVVAAGGWGTNGDLWDFDDATSLIALGYSSRPGAFSHPLSSVGTNIGNLTSYGGLAAAYDGTTSQAYSASAALASGATPGTIGKQWASAKTITGFRVFGPNNSYTNTAGSGVYTSTYKLQGSNDGSGWTDLYSSTVADAQNLVVTVTSGITTSNAYAYHRITWENANGATCLAEVEFYEAGAYAIGNNWTLNNFSLTAGTTYDHMLDVPGNSYATLNPLRPNGGAHNQNAELTEGNLRAYIADGAYWYQAVATMPVPSGAKAYAEFLPTTIGGTFVGITKSPNLLSSYAPGESTDGYSFHQSLGIRYNGAQLYAGTYTTTDVISVSVDRVNNQITFKKNNTTVGAAISIADVDWYFTTSITAGSITYLCAGQAPLHASATYDSAAGGYFRYTPPTGFKALCQANLPTPAILNPKLHFDINTRTGTAATYSVTGLLFQPDLVWSKSRGRAVDHALYDSVRGVQKQLESNSTGVETTETTGLTAFNSDGYTGGALDQINGTTATNSFIDWLWKAGGASVSNTAGSITSQVSANVDAGFSIVTYTGTGANATVGHGLGKAPSFMIVIGRNGSYSFPCYHSALGGTKHIYLNGTGAAATDTIWNSVAPSASVFSLGSYSEANGSTRGYVAYCFADIEGYSKAFSYTGNGSADGPYVHLGFKPRWILLKRTDGTGAWIIYDAVRSTYNSVNLDLEANTASAENSDFGNGLDITSSAFKIRDASLQFNASSGTYIGFAIADVAGKYSLGR